MTNHTTYRLPKAFPCRATLRRRRKVTEARFRCGSAPSPVRGESRKRNCGQRGPRGCDATKAKKDLQYYPHLFPSTYVKGTRAYACYAGTGHPGPSAIAIGPMSYRWTSQSFVSSICLLDPAAVRWIVTGLAIFSSRGMGCSACVAVALEGYQKDKAECPVPLTHI